MRKAFVVFLLAVLLLAGCTEVEEKAPEPFVNNQVAEITSGKSNMQGVAFNFGNSYRHVYIVFTKSKYNKHTSTIKVFDSFGSERDDYAKEHHLGDIEVVGGKLYAPVSSCDVRLGYSIQKIKVYDTFRWMQLVREINLSAIFPRIEDCVGAIGYHDKKFYVGNSYLGGDHEDQIAVFDKDLNFLYKHNVKTNCNAGIQGIEYIDTYGKLLYTCHSNVSYVIDTDLSNESIRQLFFPSKVQGLEYDKSTNMLWYVDRADNTIKAFFPSPLGTAEGRLSKIDGKSAITIPEEIVEAKDWKEGQSFLFIWNERGNIELHKI